MVLLSFVFSESTTFSGLALIVVTRWVRPSLGVVGDIFVVPVLIDPKSQGLVDGCGRIPCLINFSAYPIPKSNGNIHAAMIGFLKRSIDIW